MIIKNYTHVQEIRKLKNGHLKIQNYNQYL